MAANNKTNFLTTTTTTTPKLILDLISNATNSNLTTDSSTIATTVATNNNNNTTTNISNDNPSVFPKEAFATNNSYNNEIQRNQSQILSTVARLIDKNAITNSLSTTKATIIKAKAIGTSTATIGTAATISSGAGVGTGTSTGSSITTAAFPMSTEEPFDEFGPPEGVEYIFVPLGVLIFVIVLSAVVLFISRKRKMERLRHRLMPLYNFDPGEEEEDDWETELLDESYNNVPTTTTLTAHQRRPGYQSMDTDENAELFRGH